MSTAFVSHGVSRTPEDLDIAPRNMHFNVAVLSRDWHGGDPFRTAYFNALSIMFPIGEQQFIDSVKFYRDQIVDPTLQDHARAFAAQEYIHRREHQLYNEALCASRGYPLERLEVPIRRRLTWALKHLPPVVHLASTVAYEHWTAMLADALLRNPQVLEGADPAMAALWRWHAIEESEHKAVAFDVYNAIGGSLGLRRRIMLIITVQFFLDTFRHMRLMLRGYQGSHLALWAHGMKFLFGKGGLYRGLGRTYLDYFRKDFHPWDHDNRVQIARAVRELELNEQAA